MELAVPSLHHAAACTILCMRPQRLCATHQPKSFEELCSAVGRVLQGLSARIAVHEHLCMINSYRLLKEMHTSILHGGQLPSRHNAAVCASLL